MAQLAKNFEVAPMTCVQVAFRSRVGVMGGIAGLLLTWGVLALGGNWFARNQPPDATINAAEILTATSGMKPRSIRVRITISPNPNCVRTSQEVLTPHLSQPDSARDYYPIASSINGMGFPLATQTFNLIAAIPPGIPDGEYDVLHRSTSACRYFFGLLSYVAEYGAPPVPVTIGP